MKLTVNYPDKAIAEEIIDYCMCNCGLEGDEPEMVNVPVSDLVSLLEIEMFLERTQEFPVDLPKDLRFVEEQEDVFNTLGDMFRPEPTRNVNPLSSFVNKLNQSF